LPGKANSAKAAPGVPRAGDMDGPTIQTPYNWLNAKTEQWQLTSKLSYNGAEMEGTA